jgi:poly-gamma-glutamate capsule biosynthesis protein CapA/YwtB (metallophosphatase superfamily)
VVMTFLGDCTLGCEERLMSKEYGFAKVAQREGYSYFLARMQPFLSEDDLTVANFEGVLKDNMKSKANKTYCFRGLPAYGQILSLGSIEAVNLSNNHTGDFGNAGRESTLQALTDAGIATFDAENEYVLEKDGVTIAFCGFWRVGYYSKRDTYIQEIQKLKANGADAVICSLHFGQEYGVHHGVDQTEMAHTMIDAGADLVIGHHPHVVQGMEVYNGATILYSLGNFLFGGNPTVRANECLISRVTMTFSDDGNYLGQQVRLYPGNISGDDQKNDYQPRLVTGEKAQAVFTLLDSDSEGQNPPVTQTDAHRDYAYLAAQRSEELP